MLACCTASVQLAYMPTTKCYSLKIFKSLDETVKHTRGKASAGMRSIVSYTYVTTCIWICLQRHRYFSMILCLYMTICKGLCVIIWLFVCECVYDSVHTTALLVSIVRFVTWKLINFLVLVLGWMHVSAVMQQIESPLVVTSCHIPTKKIPFACPAPLQVATIQDDQQREQALTNAWFDQCLQNVFRHHHLSHSAGPMFQWSIHWSFIEMTQDIWKDYTIAISRWSEYIMIL